MVRNLPPCSEMQQLRKPYMSREARHKADRHRLSLRGYWASRAPSASQKIEAVFRPDPLKVHSYVTLALSALFSRRNLRLADTIPLVEREISVAIVGHDWHLLRLCILSAQNLSKSINKWPDHFQPLQASEMLQSAWLSSFNQRMAIGCNEISRAICGKRKIQCGVKWSLYGKMNFRRRHRI